MPLKVGLFIFIYELIFFTFAFVFLKLALFAFSQPVVVFDSFLLSSVTARPRVTVFLSCPNVELAISPRRAVCWTPLPCLQGNSASSGLTFSSSLEGCPGPLEVVPTPRGLERVLL